MAGVTEKAAMRNKKKKTASTSGKGLEQEVNDALPVSPFDKPKPGVKTIATAPNNIYQLPLEFENHKETTTDKKTSTGSTSTDRKLGWETAREEIASIADKTKQEGEAKEREISAFKAENPEAGTMGGRYGIRQELAGQYQTKVDQALSQLTGQMNQNQQNDFFEKIIDAMGQGISGVVGLHTQSPVAENYKPINLFDREKDDARAKDLADRNFKEIGINYDKQQKPMEQAEKDLEGAETSLKDRTSQINAWSRAGGLDVQQQGQRTGFSNTTGSTQEQGGGWKEQGFNVPAPRPGAAGKGTGEEAPDPTNYLKGMSTAINQYNQVRPRLMAIKSPSEFINQLSQSITSWGRAGGMSLTADPAALGSRYTQLASQNGNDFNKVREAMLSELSEGLTANYGSGRYNSYDDAHGVWAKYGLPVSSITFKKGTRTAVPSPSINAKPSTPAQAPQTKPAPSTGGKTYRVTAGNGTVYPRVPAERLDKIRKLDPKAQIVENP